ncbi:hypothetical protein M2651_07850 [Clostridium sp. SYSU_GA19001]|nr:hypothetical protein [Clostridium caldaquaticum]
MSFCVYYIDINPKTGGICIGKCITTESLGKNLRKLFFLRTSCNMLNIDKINTVYLAREATDLRRNEEIFMV